MASFLADPRKYPYRAGGLFLGHDGKGQEVGISTDRHAITIAGSRAGKGACLLIPNALRWPYNLLVVDPKGEVAAASWEAREALGQAVHVLDPFKVADVPDHLRVAFNPLATIDPDSPTAREDIQVIADGLVKRSDPKHEEWYAGAVALLAGLMAFAVETAPPDMRSFAGVRSLLLQPSQDLYATAQEMLGCTAFGGLARETGVTLMTACESEKGMEKDFLGAARRATSWMDSPPIAAVLASSSFDLAALKNGAASVFLVLPPQYLDTHGAFLRLFVRAALSAMMKDGARVNRRCLFMLDEFAALGRLDVVAKGMGLMAGYGLHLWPFLQDLGQLQDLYGEKLSETFFGNADLAAFFGNTDALTLKYVSERIGNLTPNEVRPDIPKASAAAQGESGFFTDFIKAAEANERAKYDHDMKRVGTPRVTPVEVQTMTGKGEGEAVSRGMFAFVKAGDTLFLRPAPYFQKSAQPKQVTEKSGKKLGRKYGPLDFAAGVVAFLLMGATFGPLSEPETVPEETWPFLYVVWAVLTPLLIGLVILMRKNR